MRPGHDRAGDGAANLTPTEMDQILSAYGAAPIPSVEGSAQLRARRDGKPVFETGTITWGPKVIDQILKAYQ